jgi:TetR/AcrR family transcriptional regulator, regulator of biofilm formation and stress response
LLEAALGLIAESGVHAVTLRDVAARAEMSLGSTSYHFRDRDQLMQNALEKFAADVVSRCDAVINNWESSETEPDQLLDMMLTLLGDLYADQSQAFAQIELYVQASRVPELAVAARRCMQSYGQVLARALQAAGVDVQQAPLRAARMVTYLDGLALQASAQGGSMQLPSDATTTLWILATAEA